MTFTLRLATPADSDAVSALLACCYPVLLAGHYAPDVLDVLLPRMTTANPALLGSGSYWLAVDGAGTVIGCGGWTRERPGTGAVEDGLGHIRHVGVDPGWAGRGVGRALLRRCFEQARAASVRELECLSTLNAEAFYRALGFETLRTLEVALGPGPGLPSLEMRRAL